jgi:hypothetical protein
MSPLFGLLGVVMGTYEPAGMLVTGRFGPDRPSASGSTDR